MYQPAGIKSALEGFLEQKASPIVNQKISFKTKQIGSDFHSKWQGGGRRRIDAVAGNDRGDEDVHAAEFEVDARLALLHAADHLGAEHALIILRGSLRIRAAQVNVVISELGHRGCSRGSNGL